jgi:hypothetical protein
MISPVTKPWAGVSGEWRLFRTDEQMEHGISQKPIGEIMPTMGVVVVVTIPEEATLLAKHVAYRVAALVAEAKLPEWKALERVILDTMDALAGGHGLDRKHHHHVAQAHAGRFFAHPSHVPEDLLAEYLLTGKVALHDAGGEVQVDDGKRKYTAYAQPGHAEDSRTILKEFPARFEMAAQPLLDALKGRILVA